SRRAVPACAGSFCRNCSPDPDPPNRRCTMSKPFPVCSIMPPYLMLKLLESKERDDRLIALNTLVMTARLRGERETRATFTAAAAPAHGRRTIFDCRHSTILSDAVVARTEDGEASTDESVNRAFDGFGTTRDFYKQVFDRDSIDGHGMRLDGYVHRGTRFNNA